jgi:hypothetical protein
MYNRLCGQCMRHWTIKDNYTSIEYRGVIPATREGWGEPTETSLVTDGVIVPCQIYEDIEAIRAAEEGRDWGFQTTYAKLFMGTYPGYIEVDIRNRELKNRKSKVDVSGRPVDLNEWAEPPHVEFANCDFKTAEDVKRFVDDYGVSFLMCDYTRSVKETGQSEMNPITTVERMQTFQWCLRNAWRGDDDALRIVKWWAPTRVDFANGKPHTISEDIWEYMCALFLADHSDNRIRICENPQCKLLKYFIANRRDQKFCSDTCRNTVNVNLWLADPENRKQFNEKRRLTKGS